MPNNSGIRAYVAHERTLPVVPHAYTIGSHVTHAADLVLQQPADEGRLFLLGYDSTSSVY